MLIRKIRGAPGSTGTATTGAWRAGTRWRKRRDCRSRLE